MKDICVIEKPVFGCLRNQGWTINEIYERKYPDMPIDVGVIFADSTTSTQWEGFIIPILGMLNKYDRINLCLSYMIGGNADRYIINSVRRPKKIILCYKKNGEWKYLPYSNPTPNFWGR